MTVVAKVGSILVSLEISGMTCGSCAARIERHLNGLDGVTAQVNFATERATITAPPGVTPEDLVAEISGMGYAARRAGGGLVDGGDGLANGTTAAPEANDETRAPATGPGDEAARRVRMLSRRLLMAALLFMPLCDASVAFSLVPSIRFMGWQWLLLAMAAPVVTWAAWPFHAAAFRHGRHGLSTMDTLVSLGVISATAWSVYAMFFEDTVRHGHSLAYLLARRSGGSIYLDVAAGVTTFLLAGRWFEARSRQRSGDALRRLAALAAKEVSVLDADGLERRRPAAVLATGDRFVVRPGERIATDGEVESGESAIDCSLMTGESQPVDAAAGDTVTGGTVCLSGRLVVRATKVGADTQLSHMLALVEHAQNEKANVQRLADRVSAVFVPVVIVLALATLTGWLASGADSLVALNAGLSVLIIACPCALGLATPAALFVATSTGARRGIFFKGYRSLEASQEIDTVVFDKTGTITEGCMSLAAHATVNGVTSDELLMAAGSLETASEHPVGRAIAAAAAAELGALAPVGSFAAAPGLGATGAVDGHAVSVGRAALGSGAVPPALARGCAEWEALGRTAVIVRRDGVVIGAMAVGDAVRPSAAAAVSQVRSLGLRCVLLSGDNEPTARAVAAAVGIEEVESEVLPAEKVAKVDALRAEGRSVAVVGDGINDAPALAAADLGLAVGSGTDVTLDAADIIVLRDDLRLVPQAVVLARRTLRTIRSNLVWAFAYNLLAIPVAASGLLDPLIAGGAMAMSSVFVVWNSLRLRHVTDDG